MDIDLLKTFLVLTRTRHFGQAAQQLYLTQSAVSFRIKQLEEQLGESLFIRHRNNIQLSPAGQQFVSYAEQLMALWQQAKQQLQTEPSTVALQLGATQAIWQGYLTQQVIQLADPVQSYSATLAVLREQLLQQQLDLLIQPIGPQRAQWQYQSLTDLVLQLFYWPSHNEPIYWAIPWSIKPIGLAQNIRVKQTIQVVDAQMASQLLAQRGGYAYLPKHYQQHYPDLQQIAGQSYVCPMQAVWRKESEKLPQINQLVSQLLS